MEEIKTKNISEDKDEKLSLPAKENKKGFFTEGGIFSILSIFAVAFLISFFVFQVFMVPIKVVGSSMQPTLNMQIESETDENHSDIVYYHKQKSYKNDDIVIIENKNKAYVNNSSVNFIIKRIIACPGQTITFFVTDTDTSEFLNTVYYYDVLVKDKNGNVINLDDSYLSSKNKMKFSESDYLYLSTSNESPILAEIYKGLMNEYSTNAHTYSITLGKNEYFVMGDNRNNSEDSRYFGTVKNNTIAGKVLLQVDYGKNVWQAIWKKITNK